MLKFVNDKQEVVMTEKDNGEVEFHIQEDKEKVKKAEAEQEKAE